MDKFAALKADIERELQNLERLTLIEDPEKRMEAQQLRAWFAEEFLNELTE